MKRVSKKSVTRTFVVSLFSAVFSLNAYSESDGLITKASPYDFDTTVSHLKATLKDKGMTIFKAVNHTEGAKKVGKALRPTEVVIFGNPKSGTLLMQCEQRAAIDLPQKALVWQDKDGKVWLSYNDPEYLAERHGIDDCGGAVQKISNALKGIAEAATEK